jgi:hypothetical protein
LKIWCREGVETIFLKGTPWGTFAVLREWTDQGKLEDCGSSAHPRPIFNPACLIEITDMVRAIDRNSKEALDK